MTHELLTGGGRGYLRIATEEAFATREQIDIYRRMVKDGTADKGMVSLWGFYAHSPSERATQILERLLDLGPRRIGDMDATGIDQAVLALTSPGAQPILDVGEARRLSQSANDQLAEHVAAWPQRYVGMTAVAPQDPEGETERSAMMANSTASVLFAMVEGTSLQSEFSVRGSQFSVLKRNWTENGEPQFVSPSHRW